MKRLVILVGLVLFLILFSSYSAYGRGEILRSCRPGITQQQAKEMCNSNAPGVMITPLFYFDVGSGEQKPLANTVLFYTGCSDVRPLEGAQPRAAGPYDTAETGPTGPEIVQSYDCTNYTLDTIYEGALSTVLSSPTQSVFNYGTNQPEIEKCIECQHFYTTCDYDGDGLIGSYGDCGAQTDCDDSNPTIPSKLAMNIEAAYQDFYFVDLINSTYTEETWPDSGYTYCKDGKYRDTPRGVIEGAPPHTEKKYINNAYSKSAILDIFQDLSVRGGYTCTRPRSKLSLQWNKLPQSAFYLYGDDIEGRQYLDEDGYDWNKQAFKSVIGQMDILSWEESIAEPNKLGCSIGWATTDKDGNPSTVMQELEKVAQHGGKYYSARIDFDVSPNNLKVQYMRYHSETNFVRGKGFVYDRGWDMIYDTNIPISENQAWCLTEVFNQWYGGAQTVYQDQVDFLINCARTNQNMFLSSPKDVYSYYSTYNYGGKDSDKYAVLYSYEPSLIPDVTRELKHFNVGFAGNQVGRKLKQCPCTSYGP